MKKNNNLIKITNIEKNEVKYFTKDSYVIRYIGCTQGSLASIRSGHSRDYNQFIYEIVDGSDVVYKNINDIPLT